MNPREQQEVISIVMAAAFGEATEDQLARISRLVVESDEWRTFILNLLSQEAWLTWHGSSVQGAERQLASGAQLARMIEAGEIGGQVTSARGTSVEPAESTAAPALPLKKQRSRHSTAFRWGKNRDDRFAPVLAATLLLAVGTAFGALANRWFSASDESLVEAASSGAPALEEFTSAPMLASYQARLMHGTACVWAPEMRSRLTSQKSLQSGDALNLIAGLAELELSWPMRGNATLRLEGPAGLVLMADGGASLNYGKLTANVALQYDSFAVETPIGRVVVGDNAHIGIAVSSGTVEVHVFFGHADVTLPWSTGTGSPETLKIRSGRSLRLRATDSGTVDLTRGPALSNRFASQVSMGSDLLDIPAEYVETIREAAPVIYWRFDMPQDHLVKNVMSDRYHARVMGKPGWIQEHGNMSVQFGTGLDVEELRAFLVTEEPFENFTSGTYSIELWAKPSHYHLGTMVSLVGSEGSDAPTVPKGSHGVLLELGGMRALYSSIEHPGRIRFLHRDPPGGDPASGTSCFSKQPYALRRWQHVVAVKDQAEMRLYVDAQLVASAADRSKLSPGLELLVGQMDRERDWRPFVGQMDELTFYDRALTADEIEQHYRLVRPKRVPARGI